MQSLSRHLRPAPYPYGLLTLRLLGKLGGKNRQFLREPMLICAPTELDVESEIAVDCFWSRANDAMEEPDSCEVLSVHLPLGRCVETLKMIALTHRSDEVIGNTANNIDCTHLRVGSHLWECKIENLDIASYSKEVIDAIKKDQASASLIVIRSAIEQVFDRISSGVDGAEKNDILLSDEKNICIGLLYACMVDATKDDAWVILKDLAVKINQATLAGSLALFLSEPSSLAAEVGLQLLDFLLNLEDNRERSSNDALFDVIVCSLCETCCSSSWGRQSGPQEAMCKMTATLGTEWSRRHEVKLVNAAFLPVKTVPRDVAEAAINALKVFIQICSTLYGKQACHVSERDMMVWDILSSDERPETWESKDSSEPTDVANEANPVGIRPSEEVFKLCVYELTSPQQLVR